MHLWLSQNPDVLQWTYTEAQGLVEVDSSAILDLLGSNQFILCPWAVLKEISPGCSLEGLMLKLKLQFFGYLMQRTDSFAKTLMLGKIEARRRRGWQRTRWLEYHHQLSGHGFGWTLRVGDGQGGLACCRSWGCKESDTTEQLNWTELIIPWKSSQNTTGLSRLFIYELTRNYWRAYFKS